MNILYVGIDLAKNVFAVHGVNEFRRCRAAPAQGRASQSASTDRVAAAVRDRHAADAMAICEAVQRPNMRFVPIKTEDQQSRLLVRRPRQGFAQARTATLNRIRGLMSEFGIVLPLKAEVVRCETSNHLEDLPGYANTVIGDLLSDIAHLDERINLVLGARAVLNAATNKTDSLSRWAVQLLERRGHWKAVVAIAAKNARMAWAVLTKGEAFKLPT